MTTTAIYQSTECLICHQNPFARNRDLQSTTWYGHSVIDNPGPPFETRKIHGICQSCLPVVPVNVRLQPCLCGQRSLTNRKDIISITREGTLLSETLEPLTRDILLYHLKNNQRRIANLIGSTGLILIGASFRINRPQKSAEERILFARIVGSILLTIWVASVCLEENNRSAPIHPNNVLNENPQEAPPV